MAALALAPAGCYVQRMADAGTGAVRVRRRREKLRVAGLRPVQLWVPDTCAPDFAAECARQARLIRDGSVKNLGRYAASWIAGWPKRLSSTAALT